MYHVAERISSLLYLYFPHKSNTFYCLFDTVLCMHACMHIIIYIFFFNFISEHSQVTPGLPMLQVIYYNICT